MRVNVIFRNELEEFDNVSQYGVSLSYSVMKNIDVKCSSIMKLSNSDYLDSSSMSPA